MRPLGLNARPDTPACNGPRVAGCTGWSVSRTCPVAGSHSLMRPPHCTEATVRPSGAEGNLADLSVMIAKRQSRFVAEPVQILPLPPTEVGVVLARLHQIELETEPADVVGSPGGQGKV